MRKTTEFQIEFGQKATFLLFTNWARELFKVCDF